LANGKNHLKGATLIHDDFRFPKGLALLGENHLNTAKPVMMIFHKNHLNTAKPVMMIFAFGRKAFKTKYISCVFVMTTFINKLKADQEQEDDVISLITIIDNEIIHNKTLYSFPPDEERKMKFGIIKINTDVLPKVNKVLFFLFSVDCSGSMSDLCNDRRTKNDHIIHTLTNM